MPGCGLRGDGADLDVAEAEAEQSGHGARVLVEAGRETEGVRELDAHHRRGADGTWIARRVSGPAARIAANARSWAFSGSIPANTDSKNACRPAVDHDVRVSAAPAPTEVALAADRCMAGTMEGADELNVDRGPDRVERRTVLEAAVIFLAGIWAGGINVIVGSGTLVTFPTLLLFGYPPLTANVSNNIGMVAGGISGIYGYRRELEPNRSMLLRLAPASVIGALVGALLLLLLPDESFRAIVPVLISIGLLMVIVGPALQRRAARRSLEPNGDGNASVASRIGLPIGVAVLGAYGGYFGAAQGILLVGLMGMILSEGIQRINAIKNVLSTVVNAVAAVTFLIVAWDQIDWPVVGLISSGTFVGGYLGAHIGRRLPPVVLRSVIIVIGVLALVKLLFFD